MDKLIVKYWNPHPAVGWTLFAALLVVGFVVPKLFVPACLFCWAYFSIDTRKLKVVEAGQKERIAVLEKKLSAMKVYDKKELHVVSVVFNPSGYNSRIKLFNDFSEYMEQCGVNFYVVELAFDDKPFVATQSDNPHHLQLRTNDKMWYKENLINLGIQKLLPKDYKYVAWIDADIRFLRTDWVEATIEALQKYPIVQPWQYAYDLDATGNAMTKATSLGYAYQTTKKVGKKDYSIYWHPGYGWAGTRELIEGTGGLLEECVCGSADFQMAHASIGNIKGAIHGQSTPNMKQLAFDWQDKFKKNVGGEVGFVEGSIVHFWHGAKAKRKYVERWSIVLDNKFDPYADVRRREDGLLEFSSNKPKLREDLIKYFDERCEDDNK